ncbi:MAG TPA: hypothetical protein DCS83_09255 [Prevotella sp.]|nr:hypothetical protein [Prevotella sp.]
MCIIKDVKHFMSNGVKIFRQASLGEYDAKSDSVKEIYRDMFENSKSNSTNLRSDREKIGRDMRSGFNKVIKKNGETINKTQRNSRIKRQQCW